MNLRQTIGGLLFPILILQRAVAQDPASRTTRPHCNTDPTPPLLGMNDLGDSAVLHADLRIAADTAEPVTSVAVTYQEDGSVAKVRATAGTSEGSAHGLENAFRAHLVRLRPVPKHFAIAVARLNTTDQVDVLPGLYTCLPQRLSTPETDSILETLQHEMSHKPGYYSDSRFVRPAVVELWLEPTGEIRAIWIEASSNDVVLDSIALQFALKPRYVPPLVGSRGVPALLKLPLSTISMDSILFPRAPAMGTRRRPP